MSITASRIAKKLALLGMLAASVVIMTADARGGICLGGTLLTCETACQNRYDACCLVDDLPGCLPICDQRQSMCFANCRRDCPPL